MNKRTRNIIITLIGATVLILAAILQDFYGNISYYHLKCTDGDNMFYYDSQSVDGKTAGDLTPASADFAVGEEWLFEAGGLYEMQFDFPEELLNAFRNQNGNYNIRIVYDCNLEAGEVGQIEAKITTSNPRRTYIASGTYQAKEEMHLRDVQVNNTMGKRMTFSYYVNGIPQGLVFYLETYASSVDIMTNTEFVEQHDFGKFSWQLVGLEKGKKPRQRSASM